MDDTRIVFRVKELAKYLNVSQWLVRDLTRKNVIPYYKIGSLYMYDKSTIDKWKENQMK